jgi:hypothetical protein
MRDSERTEFRKIWGFNPRPQTVLCSKDRPWTPAMGTPVIHEDAKEIGAQEGGYPGGDLVTMKCPNCGHEWTKELPQ